MLLSSALRDQSTAADGGRDAMVARRRFCSHIGYNFHIIIFDGCDQRIDDLRILYYTTPLVDDLNF